MLFRSGNGRLWWTWKEVVLMTDLHLSTDRLREIVNESRIKVQEAEHIRKCHSCNGTLRAIAAIASTGGTKVRFKIPPEPEQNFTSV